MMSLRTGPRTSFLVVALAVLTCLSCAARHELLLPAAPTAGSRNPVVIIPGITGSQLRDRETGEIVWGTASRLFGPRDDGYALARPIGIGAADRLEAFAPLLELALPGPWKVDVYASLVRALEDHGYRRGKLEAPHPGDDLFVFFYDWRYGNLRAVRALAAQLEELRRARGDAVLRVDLVCHSNAARVARYFVKYGAASLDSAADGTPRRPTPVEVDKLILVGTANGGALATFEDLLRGRKYVPLLGRRLRPEVLFTMPSLYEALPLFDERPFLDADRHDLDVRLAEPAAWKRYGWSIYDPEARDRVRRAGRPDLFGDEAQRDAFLQQALESASRLHRVLLRDVAQPGRTRYYSIQSKSRPTPRRALLERHGDRWRTRVGPGAPRRWPRAYAPGDGHATVASQQMLSPQEHAALAHAPVYVSATHRQLVRDPDAQRWILRFLLE